MAKSNPTLSFPLRRSVSSTFVSSFVLYNDLNDTKVTNPKNKTPVIKRGFIVGGR